MHPLQAMMDGMSKEWQRQRAESQMTLGKMIARLEDLPSDAKIDLVEPCSYRGYYEDLAFQLASKFWRGEREASSAAELLEVAKRCMGKTYQGYKGGDYVMGETTPVWVAEYGSCGEKLIAINDDGTLVTAADED